MRNLEEILQTIGLGLVLLAIALAGGFLIWEAAKLA